jgi:hypothetical protein
VGQLQCVAFLDAKNDSPELYHQFGGWITGYLTGLNQATPNTFDYVLFEDIETLSLYVERYCRKNRNDAFLLAVRAVAEALSATGLNTASKLVSIGDARKIVIYEKTLEMIEGRLRELGYLDTGKNGSEAAIREALVAFQLDVGLGESGVPDQPTLVRLLREDPP